MVLNFVYCRPRTWRADIPGQEPILIWAPEDKKTFRVVDIKYDRLSEGNFRTFEGAYDKACIIAADRTKEA